MKTSFYSLAAVVLVIATGSIAAAQNQNAPSKSTKETAVSNAGTDDFGTLVFEDSFDRNETQNEIDEVGNGWTTNGQKSWAKGPNQTDLRDGALYAVPADGKRSDVLVIRPADLHDSTIQFRFLLPNDDDRIGLVVADSKLKEVHAGHVMNVWMSKGAVKVSDMMNGFFKPEIYERRKARKLTKDDNARIAAMGKTFDAPIKTATWHQVTITTKKDQLTVSIDDKVVGQFVAPAFAHHKNILRVSIRHFGAFDDFKIYDAKSRADSSGSGDPSASKATATEYVDTFVSSEFKGREFVAPRGEWTFENGVASATSTVELLKKNTIHGPNIKWHVEFTSGSIEFEMKPEDCQRITFTLNGGGHIFRWVSTACQPGSVYGEQAGNKYRHSLIAWAEKSTKHNKGDFIDAQPIKHLSELQNRWTKVSLNIDGDSGTLQVGDDIHRLSHAAFKRLKTNIVFSFGYGKLSIRNFRYSIYDERN